MNQEVMILTGAGQIGMAKLLDIPASTLRYYDKQGLLPFVERSKSGIRMFQEKDYEWLKLIECLKKSGLTLSEIKNYIFMAIRGDETIEDRLQLFLNQKEVITQKITMRIWKRKPGTASAADDAIYAVRFMWGRRNGCR